MSQIPKMYFEMLVDENMKTNMSGIKKKIIDIRDFFSYLPLHIVNCTAGSVSVGAVVFVVNLLDGVIHLVFNLKQKHSSAE